MLYPGPNVAVPAPDVVVARAGARAAREMDAAPVMTADVRAVLADFAAVAARAVPDDITVLLCAVRADCNTAPPRVVAARDGAVAAVRVITPALRAVVVALRPGAGCDDWGADCRLILALSRTAALAKPMPTAKVPAKSKNFFISMPDMISKSLRSGNGYLMFGRIFSCLRK